MSGSDWFRDLAGRAQLEAGSGGVNPRILVSCARGQAAGHSVERDREKFDFTWLVASRASQLYSCRA